MIVIIRLVFAKKTKFQRRIIPGMLSASFIATSVWKTFGDGTVFVNQKLNFLKPIFVEDKLSVELTTLTKSYSNEMKLKVVCKVEDETRIDAELIILLPD